MALATTWSSDAPSPMPFLPLQVQPVMALAWPRP
jgi:hypothetical protein